MQTIVARGQLADVRRRIKHNSACTGMDLLEDVSSEESLDNPVEVHSESQGSSRGSEGYESGDQGGEDTEESETESLAPDSGFRSCAAFDVDEAGTFETEVSPVTRVTQKDCFPGVPFLSSHDAHTLRAASKVHAKMPLQARLSPFWVVNRAGHNDLLSEAPDVSPHGRLRARVSHQVSPFSSVPPPRCAA